MHESYLLCGNRLFRWCHWVEPVWKELKKQYDGRVEFEWKIALMNPGDFPVSQAQCDWFYRRSGGTVMRSRYKLNSGWLEAERKGHYEVPNWVAEAGKDFGFAGDELRLALSDAAVLNGIKIGDLTTAVKIAAKAGKIDAKKLRTAAESKTVKARVEASTAEFLSTKSISAPLLFLRTRSATRRFSRAWFVCEPLTATIDAMLAGSRHLQPRIQAHHGGVPRSLKPPVSSYLRVFGGIGLQFPVGGFFLRA